MFVEAVPDTTCWEAETLAMGFRSKIDESVMVKAKYSRGHQLRQKHRWFWGFTTRSQGTAIHSWWNYVLPTRCFRSVRSTWCLALPCHCLTNRPLTIIWCLGYWVIPSTPSTIATTSGIPRAAFVHSPVSVS